MLPASHPFNLSSIIPSPKPVPLKAPFLRQNGTFSFTFSLPRMSPLFTWKSSSFASRFSSNGNTCESLPAGLPRGSYVLPVSGPLLGPRALLQCVLGLCLSGEHTVWHCNLSVSNLFALLLSCSVPRFRPATLLLFSESSILSIFPGT